jgi:hypothetical protein
MWVVPLAAISGIANMLEYAIGNSWGDTLLLPAILAIVLMIGPILGCFGMYLGGLIYRWSGGILGGKASSEEVRAAIAWSSIPSIASGLLSIPIIFIFGSETFTTETPRFDAYVQNTRSIGLLLSLVLIGLGLASIGLFLWRIFLLLRCLAEVHRFSSWRACTALLIPAAILLVPLFCVVLAL